MSEDSGWLHPADIASLECWRLTPALRWNGEVLEQAWQRADPKSRGEIEWRQVASVMNPAEAIG